MQYVARNIILIAIICFENISPRCKSTNMAADCFSRLKPALQEKCMRDWKVSREVLISRLHLTSWCHKLPTTPQVYDDTRKNTTCFKSNFLHQIRDFVDQKSCTMSCSKLILIGPNQGLKDAGKKSHQDHSSCLILLRFCGSGDSWLQFSPKSVVISQGTLHNRDEVLSEVWQFPTRLTHTDCCVTESKWNDVYELGNGDVEGTYSKVSRYYADQTDKMFRRWWLVDRICYLWTYAHAKCWKISIKSESTDMLFASWVEIIRLSNFTTAFKYVSSKQITHLQPFHVNSTHVWPDWFNNRLSNILMYAPSINLIKNYHAIQGYPYN